ncbi:hypothetical protein CYMTET_27196 [Cymbomonas tetramitiformis]|uniref:Uncharacterized protein n=1 Tax=Cymbomonas tetramitiformis TaxID=36881 RepID=A0AAE0FQJ5_9CHLO|nr:hypothetical protein CYMTET_27196 [Cymbomonas tetramitiformis]
MEDMDAKIKVSEEKQEVERTEEGDIAGNNGETEGDDAEFVPHPGSLCGHQGVPRGPAFTGEPENPDSSFNAILIRILTEQEQFATAVRAAASSQASQLPAEARNGKLAEGQPPAGTLQSDAVISNKSTEDPFLYLSPDTYGRTRLLLQSIHLNNTKIPMKTPLSLLHDYAMRSKSTVDITCDEVPSEQKPDEESQHEKNGGFSVMVQVLNAGQLAHPSAQGSGVMPSKKVARQVAAAACIESLLGAGVPQSDFTERTGKGAGKGKGSDPTKGGKGKGVGKGFGKGKGIGGGRGKMSMGSEAGDGYGYRETGGSFTGRKRDFDSALGGGSKGSKGGKGKGGKGGKGMGKGSKGGMGTFEQYEEFDHPQMEMLEMYDPMNQVSKMQRGNAAEFEMAPFGAEQGMMLQQQGVTYMTQPLAQYGMAGQMGGQMGGQQMFQRYDPMAASGYVEVSDQQQFIAVPSQQFEQGAPMGGMMGVPEMGPNVIQASDLMGATNVQVVSQQQAMGMPQQFMFR